VGRAGGPGHILNLGHSVIQVISEEKQLSESLHELIRIDSLIKFQKPARSDFFLAASAAKFRKCRKNTQGLAVAMAYTHKADNRIFVCKHVPVCTPGGCRVKQYDGTL